MNVISELTLINKDGGRDYAEDFGKMHVKSHWNYDTRIIIAVDGHEYTVEAKELLAAISNAQRTGKGLF